MKHIFTLFILFLVFSSFAQSPSEAGIEVVRTFESLLIDFDVHKSEVVALTKENREYFIHFKDTKGNDRSQVLEIRHPNKIEIDVCQNHLYILALDSAFRIEIGDFALVVDRINIDSYNSTIKNCVALFDDVVIHNASDNALSFQWLNKSTGEKEGEPIYIDHWAQTANDETDLEEVASQNRSENTGYSSPIPPVRPLKSKPVSDLPEEIPCVLRGFRSGDRLWMFDVTRDLLMIHNQDMLIDTTFSFATDADYQIEQDQTTGNIYLTFTIPGGESIQKMDQFGVLTNILLVPSKFFDGKTKIDNGYFYFGDSESVIESIRRVKLD